MRSYKPYIINTDVPMKLLNQREGKVEREGGVKAGLWSCSFEVNLTQGFAVMKRGMRVPR